MAHQDAQNVKNSFNWLRREARGPTYISYSEFSDRLACSFEFGESGYAASCNYGGELLNMSAKDEEQGIVFAHGNFESTYYASLARAQRHDGGKATFGLGIAVNQDPFHKADSLVPHHRGSRIKLGQMIERGCFNYRWPYNEYALLLNEGEDTDPKETGTCARVSFVKDGILYQVIRLERGCRPDADRSYYVPWSGQVALAIGGPIQFAAFNTESKDDHPAEYSIRHEGGDDVWVSWGLTNQLEIRVRQLHDDEYHTLRLEQPESKDGHGRKESRCFAYVELPEGKDVEFRQRQVTLIAEFRLIRKVDGQPSPWPETPTSAQIFDHLGIEPYSRMATGVMWETIFLKREQESNYFSELSEVNLIGRCVEKILTVDLVPTAFKNENNLEFEERGPLALVSNLFLQSSIDLESLFWKLRFLVKTYLFLATFTQLCSKNTLSESSSNEDSDGMNQTHLHLIAPNASKTESRHYEAKSAWNQPEAIKKTVSWQMDRLKENIERSVAYLVRVFIQPDPQTNLLPLASRVFPSNYYYVMMTLWYVVKRCDPFEFTWKWVETDGMKSWPSDTCLLALFLPSDNLLPKDKEKRKVAFLKWYHYASVWNLCVRKKKTFLPKAWKMKNLDMKVNLLERDARRAAAAKLSACQPYSAEDEILDRLGFLAGPLNAEYSKHQAGSVASLTAKRILDRDFTRYLNPGRYSDGEKGQTCGPWEVYALCHHSRLLVENHQYSKDNGKTSKQRAENTENCRQELSRFLNAEACLIPCWERTNMTSFQSEATSVLASTLLGICQKDLLLTVATDESEHTESGSKQIDQNSIHTQLNTNSSHSNFKKHGVMLNTHDGLSVLEALQRIKTTKPPAIEWMRYEPPRLYHHSNFFNSLDDTPQLFKHSKVVERLHILFSSLNINRDPRVELNEESITQMLREHKLTIIDLKASIPEQLDCFSWQGYKCEEKRDNAAKKLSDSLVDQEIQHRAIVLPASCDSKSLDVRLLTLFCCVIHPDSMDCFINHISRFPDFSCQKGNTWVTRITLQSWSKSTISPNQYEEKTSRPGISKSTPTRSGFTRSTGYLPNIHPQETINEEDLQILLPPLLRESLQCINKDVFWSEQENPGIVSLEVSSIVLSTNGFGDFSQCTIISELLDGKGQKILSQQCKEIWERFIHQPQTARCLVFLAILGLLCQRMADQYREAMEYFIRFIDIDRYSIFDGNTLLEGRFSLTQLRLGLWSLESLFKLHNSLESSMRCIEEAAVELRAQIYYGPGRRSESLERMCEKSLEVFERKLGRLVVLNAELDQKIELNNRYKDSLSTILSLEDSKNSMQQNSTIQQLTYLTIGYLPVGLITAIFAIPSDQNVLIPSMGLGGYVASIFGLFILTFMAAMFMGQFLRSFMKLKTVRSFPSGGVGSNMTQLDLRRYLSWSSSSLSKSSSTSDIEQGKGVLS